MKTCTRGTQTNQGQTSLTTVYRSVWTPDTSLIVVDVLDPRSSAVRGNLPQLKQRQRQRAGVGILIAPPTICQGVGAHPGAKTGLQSDSVPRGTL